MISHRYRCIFVHIPKTAGKSINRFFGIKWQKHKDLARYAEELQPQLFSSYFQFAIVRNPWDRILSDYNFQNKKNAPTNEKLFALDDRGRTRSFRAWLDAVFSNPFYYESGQWGAEVSPGIHRWSPQVDWISLNGNIAVDAVLTMENLERDFEDIRWLLGRASGGLPCRNWKFYFYYSYYYDKATRKLVEDYYAKDIAAFGYRFESRKADVRWIVLKKLGTRFKTAFRNAWFTNPDSACVNHKTVGQFHSPPSNEQSKGVG